MKSFRGPACCLLLVVCQPAFGDDPVEPPAGQDATRCYKIPSDEDISSSEVVSSYREQYSPVEYPPEAGFWPLLDLVLLAAVLLLGCVMVWRHVHFRWFVIPAVLTLIYFGFVRGGCICPVGSVANMSIGLVDPEMVGLSTAAMFLLPLLAAFVMGRVFCVAGCPLGAVQSLLGGKRSLRIPAIPHATLRLLPVVALSATAWLAIRGACLLVCILDPYKTLFFFGYGWIQRTVNVLQGGFVEPGVLFVGDLTAWGIFGSAVLLGRYVHRPFCRFVCPYGVLLGLFSLVALKRRRIEQSQCVQCGICEKTCPVNAIVRDPKTGEFAVSSYHCIQCNRCSSHCRRDGIS